MTMWLPTLRGIVTLIFSLLVALLAADAQPPAKVARIGYLSLAGDAPSPNVKALLQGLRELGYIEGQNFAIEFRSAEGKGARIPDLAADLVRLKVDVIVTVGQSATRAAAHATTTTPIVMVGIGDPVGTGLVASLA